MLLTLIELRNRMLNCKPTAEIAIQFSGDSDEVTLAWTYASGSGFDTYAIKAEVHSIRVNSRPFERQMHKAKRFLKKQG
jgi:hypothetical protein